ncbi:MAG TPA: hypothetical protein VKD72_25410, partial [Gemmataceae bacterium]|nr:hypothetical protein [Gemmataceae bacterium]
TPPEPQGTKRKCYDRDHTWLRWSEEEKMGPAAIRDRHNRENLREPIGTGNSGREVVKTALKKALAERKAEQKKE